MIKSDYQIAKDELTKMQREYLNKATGLDCASRDELRPFSNAIKKQKAKVNKLKVSKEALK